MRIGRGKPGSMRMSWSSVSGSWSSSRRRASAGYASQKRSSTRHRAVTACLTRRTWPGETKCGISTNGIVDPLKTTSCSASQRSTSASSPAQLSPSLDSSTRYCSFRLLTWSISAALTLLPHRECHAIADRGERRAQVVAPAQPRVELAHGRDVLGAPRAGRFPRGDGARHQHVVDQQQAARAEQLEDLVEVAAVAVLGTVDEREVEAAVLELGEALGSVLESQVDAVGELRAGEVVARRGVALRVDLEGGHVRAAAREVQGRDADRGAHLYGAQGAGARSEHLEQTARDVVDDRDPLAIAPRPHLREQRVGLRLEPGEVLGDRRVEDHPRSGRWRLAAYAVAAVVPATTISSQPRKPNSVTTTGPNMIAPATVHSTTGAVGSRPPRPKTTSPREQRVGMKAMSASMRRPFDAPPRAPRGCTRAAARQCPGRDS